MPFLSHPVFRVIPLFVAIILLGGSHSSALDKAPKNYSESGTVSAVATKGGHVYRVETDSRIYQLLCARFVLFGSPECKLAGKPIAVGDALHFRLDNDWAYLPPPGPDDSEEKFRVISTELKDIPKLAVSTAAAADPNSKTQSASGVVTGTGMHIKGSRGGSWSTPGAGVAPGAGGPVVGVPVTGGPPVTVVPMSSGPGPVTGVPVTGGGPVTVVPVSGGQAGTAGQPMAIGGGGGPVWVHSVRVKTDSGVYELECSTKPCALGDKQIGLGETLTFRFDKKHAYLTPDPSKPSQQEKYRILKFESNDPSKQAEPADAEGKKDPE
jgi:hypothetical protein